MAKVIYEKKSTTVPADLLEAVQDAHKQRKASNPKLRVIDVWYELVEKVKTK